MAQLKSREEPLTEWMKSMLGVKITTDLLVEALTHPSCKTMDPKLRDNQRLEVVGDAVLGLLVINWFYDRLEGNEGILTRARSRTVSNNSLAGIGRQSVRIADVLRVAPAYEIHNQDVAAAVEALFGACFKSSGLDECQKLLQWIFKNRLEEVLEEVRQNSFCKPIADRSAVNVLQEHFQKQHLPVPDSMIDIAGGSDHEPVFKAYYKIIKDKKVIVGFGVGRSKKQAREKAARDLCRKIGLKIPGSNVK
ncbi:MAG: ribonuclease III family protein [Candidatus Hodarchaeales archaeon]|jgi:ribonuclease-3